MNMKSIIVRNPKLIIEEVDNEVIVFNEETQNRNKLKMA